MKQEELDALLRSRLAWFARAFFPVVGPGEPLMYNWHIDAICHQLERVLSGEIRRLIIEVPPRSLKSVIASVMFPAYCLGRDPGRKILCASYSLDLAIKHSNDCRAVMKSERYRQLFSWTQIGNGKNTEVEFHTSRRGFRYATSPSGTLTGRGGDLIILDDIMSAADAASQARRESTINWYGNTAFSRLNDKRTGAIVVVAQRLHMNDLAGTLREKGGWEILSLPAIADLPQRIPLGLGRFHRYEPGDLLHPEREPQSALDDIRATIGSYTFSAQYLQRPVPLDGEIISWRWFRRYKDLPERRDDRIVQSWDVGMKTGSTNDYSVCTTWLWSRSDNYLLDVHRVRLDFPDLIKRVVEHSRKFHAQTLLIEDMITGTALIQHLKSSSLPGMPRPIACRPDGDKVGRVVAETPTMEAGQVLLPYDAPWLEDLRSELSQFPNGRHDDQVDSMSQFLTWVRLHNTPNFTTARIR